MSQADTAPVPATPAADQQAQPDFFSSLKLLLSHGSGVKPTLAASAVLATLAVALELVPVWVVWRLVSDLATGQATAVTFTQMALIALGAVVMELGGRTG